MDGSGSLEPSTTKRKLLSFNCRHSQVSQGPAAFSEGGGTHHLNDIPPRITGPARTVVDCFKYRSRVGLDVCLEALKNILGDGVKPAEIMDYAKAQRVTSVIRPYLDALV